MIAAIKNQRGIRCAIIAAACVSVDSVFQACAVAAWLTHAGNPQHTALSSIASMPLQTIRWQTPVDLMPQYTGNLLLIHYGTPTITDSNTVIVPVKTGLTNGFRIDARNGGTGALKWSLTTDYILPPHTWTPSYSPAITPSNRVYYPGAGGTVLYRDNVDGAVGTTGRIAFFGDAIYNANTASFNSTVFINTPITSDAAGNAYFGYRVIGTSPLGASFRSGIARIAPDGSATFTTAGAAAGVPSDTAALVSMNGAPALSNDGTKLYVPIATTGNADLVELDSTSLASINVRHMFDPQSGFRAQLSQNSTASPLVGPDGDVYMGIRENGSDTHSRGYMLHFSGDLQTIETPGAFGWDNTNSVVPATMVPSYHGTSLYLLMSKYNDYTSGVYKVAILDPNATQTDGITGITEMKEVLTVNSPGGFEWCINTAVVDPATNSVLVNNEDGKLYRWNLVSNTLSQQITLTTGIGQAYTPTLIGPDGSVYAIGNAILFNVGVVPEPACVTLAIGGSLVLGWPRRSKRQIHRHGTMIGCDLG